jgi:hypothetical protein
MCLSGSPLQAAPDDLDWAKIRKRTQIAKTLNGIL